MSRNLMQAFRELTKHTWSSMVMIGSIAIGLSMSTILFAFIDRENKTDHYHSNSEYIFRLLSNDPFAESGTMAYVSSETPGYLKNFPEIQNYSSITELNRGEVQLQERDRLFNHCLVVGIDSSFFDMFDFEIKGSLLGNELGNFEIILSHDLATRIFGKSDPLGRRVSINYDAIAVPLEVVGVIEPRSDNSHFRFDAMVSLKTFGKGIRGYSTYLQMTPGTDVSSLVSKMDRNPGMPSLVGPGALSYFLQPLAEIYFDKDNRRRYTTARNPLFIQVSWIILLFIWLIALFNFINLYALRVINKKKQLAVKKIMGAVRNHLAAEVSAEVFLYTLFGAISGIGLVYVLLPFVRDILNTSLSMQYLLNLNVMVVLFSSSLFMLMITALSLTFFMDKARPLALINDLFNWKFKLNKVFLVFQFVISMALILCALVIIKQAQYIRDKPLGFDREIIEIKSPNKSVQDLIRFKEALMEIPGFNEQNMSLTTGNPIHGNGIIRVALEKDGFYTPHFMAGDENLFSTLGLNATDAFLRFPLKASDRLVNEKFVRYFDITDPIGANVPGLKGQIVGVVKDFNVASLKKEIPLYMIGYSDEPNRILINYKGRDLASCLSHIRSVHAEVYPNYPFGYSALQDVLLDRHKEDLHFTKIITFFSLLSIVLSCFGLLAMAQNNALVMKKQIAIRKALGANVINIVKLLVMDYIKWISISFIVASFIGFYAMNQWLESFAYRVSIGASTFFFTMLITLIIVAFAILGQTMKAALADPIKRLRHE